MEGSSKFKTDLSSYNNSDYRTGGSTFRRFLWYYTNAIFFHASWFPLMFAKRVMLRMFGAEVGKGLIIKPGVNIKYPWRLKIGHHVWIGEGVWIDNLGDVEIGDNVCISQGALLLCGNHDYKSPSFDLMVGQIILEDGVWLGAKSIVGPGVTCGSHAVLVAGSVASGNIEAFGVYRGNPAEKVNDRV